MGVGADHVVCHFHGAARVTRCSRAATGASGQLRSSFRPWGGPSGSRRSPRRPCSSTGRHGGQGRGDPRVVGDDAPVFCPGDVEVAAQYVYFSRGMGQAGKRNASPGLPLSSALLLQLPDLLRVRVHRLALGDAPVVPEDLQHVAIGLRGSGGIPRQLTDLGDAQIVVREPGPVRLAGSRLPVEAQGGRIGRLPYVSVRPAAPGKPHVRVFFHHLVPAALRLGHVTGPLGDVAPVELIVIAVPDLPHL